MVLQWWFPKKVLNEEDGNTRTTQWSSVLAVVGREQSWCNIGGSTCIRRRDCDFRCERDDGGNMTNREDEAQLQVQM